jgi:Na+/melibiose symporter-like transporter
MGLFFIIPLYLSVALGLSAIETGVRLLPLSLMMLIAAVGVPKFFPAASPRRIVTIGLWVIAVGIVVLFVTIDVDASEEVVFVPLLLAGLGFGALASQLGSVTVSAVPDEQSPDAGGLQNTASQFGSSLGTAFAGSVLIASLTASFLAGIAENPAVPQPVVEKANVQLASGAEFISDADLEAALEEAGVNRVTTEAILEENSEARIDGLRSALAILAILTMVPLFFTNRIPTRQPGAATPT